MDEPLAAVTWRSYRYESGTFEAELQVDEHGLVTRYGDIWAADPPAAED